MSSAAPTVSAPAPRDAPRFLRRLSRRPIAVACVLYIATMIIIAIVAPIMLPDVAGQNAGDLLHVHEGPSAQHLLGTDTLGRDVLERLLVGTRVTMVGIAEATIVLLALGLPFGLWAGFVGGWVDRAVTWLADLTFAVPAVVIVIVVLSVFPKSMTAAMVTFGVLAAPGLMRVVRAATLAVKEELYVSAARVSGLSRPYIVRHHVLPRIAGVVIVQASLLAAVALLVESGLSFLQLVVEAPAPSWGGMITEGVEAIQLQSWLIVPPGVAIGLTVMALGLLGDAVRDATTEGWAAPVRRPRARRAGNAAAAPVSMAPESVLSVQDLEVAFDSVRVVADVTFDVRAGETVGIVGESGCGKTVTAMAILGLLPGNGRVTGGQIVFGKRDLASLSEQELRGLRGKEIAFVSQEPMVSLDPVFRVGTQLAEVVRRHRGLSRQATRTKVAELLDLVRLPASTVSRYPHELSGGMAQRVSIARALAGEPNLLIADEPTTALDVTVQAEILHLLRDVQNERRMSILLVTHDWGVVADSCDRVVVMYAGQVVERAPIAPMFSQPLHPYTEALLASNPSAAPSDGLLSTIPGTVPPPHSWPQGCHFAPRCTYATDACTERGIPLAAWGARESRCIHVEELAREAVA